MKRVRADGQVSKDYYFSDGAEKQELPSDITRAAPNVLSTRRMVVALRQPDKKEQFAQHVEALNTSFFEWFRDQFNSHPSYDMSDGFQDYVDYAGILEDRFLRTYGEVLTFGSGAFLSLFLFLFLSLFLFF